MRWSLENYTPVNDRILKFKELFPDGSLAPLDPARPFWIEDVPGVGPRLIYVAAAYRSPDDPRPGIGMAWEPLPGVTPYTKGSELMVAETSAWGRALAAIGIGVNSGIASNEEVQARATSVEKPQNASRTASPTRSTPARPSGPEALSTPAQHGLIKRCMSENGVVTGKAQTEWATRILQRPVGSLEALTKREASAVIDRVKAGPPADQPEQEPEEAF
jgi:hypothetical protein